MFFIDFIRLGYSSYEPDITAQVREGTADRVYWRNIFEMAEYSSKTGWLVKDVVRGFLDDIGIDGNPFSVRWLAGR
ncbi:MAG: hypothetical protein KDI13_06415 [Alphaproteobacteria bacterium]|nr:hypothetical protein [Alphaproteobacteria bacterium]